MDRALFLDIPTPNIMYFNNIGDSVSFNSSNIMHNNAVLVEWLCFPELHVFVTIAEHHYNINLREIEDD